MRTATRSEPRRRLDEAAPLLAGEQPQPALETLDALLREGLGNEDRAEVLEARADCESRLRQHPKAHQSLLDALACEPDEVRRARVCMRLARETYYLGDFDATVNWAHQAFEPLAKTLDHEETMGALRCLGMAHVRLGHWKEAEESLRDSLTLARLTGRAELIGASLGTIGHCLSEQSRFREAFARFLEALPLSEQAGMAPTVARTYGDLAACAYGMGEFTRAAEFASEARRLHRQLGDEESIVLLDVLKARLAHRQGRDAASILGPLLANIDRVDWPWTRALIRLDCAIMDLAHGHLKAALERLEPLQPSPEPETPDDPLTHEARQMMAWAHLGLGRPEEAKEGAEAALKVSSRTGPRRDVAGVHALLGPIHAALGHPDQAQSYIREAISGFERLELPYELARTMRTGIDLDPENAPHYERRALEIEKTLGLSSPVLPIVPNLPPPPPGLSIPLGDSSHGLIVEDAVSRDLWDIARCLSALDGSVLLTGETGVGKTLLARAIHESGARAASPFVILNCAAWSPARVEAGVDADPATAFETAASGTVLLDNVDKASSALRKRLVGAFEAVGSDAGPGQATPQIISTSGRSLPLDVAAGRFPEDLFYRLKGFVLDISGLRERTDDIVPIAEAMAGEPLADEVGLALRAHDWPGNVSELRSVMRAARFRAGPETLAPEHLDGSLPSRQERATLPGRIEALERKEITGALDRTGNNKRAAARVLGVSRKGLIDRLKRLGLWEEYGKTEARTTG